MKKVITWSSKAWEDFEYWLENDKSKVKKIKDLIKDIIHSSYSGLGKPEPLKYQLADYWSRRIDLEHRLIYKVDDGTIYILQCRYYYE
jgi:toxin YoeB